MLSFPWSECSVSSGRSHCQAPISSLQAVLQSAEGSSDFLSTFYWTAAFWAPCLNRPKCATFILYHVILYVSLVLAQFVHCCCLACYLLFARQGRWVLWKAGRCSSCLGLSTQACGSARGSPNRTIPSNVTCANHKPQILTKWPWLNIIHVMQFNQKMFTYKGKTFLINLLLLSWTFWTGWNIY